MFNAFFKHLQEMLRKESYLHRIQENNAKDWYEILEYSVI